MIYKIQYRTKHLVEKQYNKLCFLYFSIISCIFLHFLYFNHIKTKVTNHWEGIKKNYQAITLTGIKKSYAVSTFYLRTIFLIIILLITYCLVVSISSVLIGLGMNKLWQLCYKMMSHNVNNWIRIFFISAEVLLIRLVFITIISMLSIVPIEEFFNNLYHVIEIVLGVPQTKQSKYFNVIFIILHLIILFAEIYICNTKFNINRKNHLTKLSMITPQPIKTHFYIKKEDKEDGEKQTFTKKEKIFVIL